MRILICVKAAVAGLVLAAVGGAWAQKQVSSTSVQGALHDGYTTAVGVATTVPPDSGRAAYVVAVDGNLNNQLLVTAWQNTFPILSPVGTPQLVKGPGIYGVAVTGLDANRVVTADIDNTGTLLIKTWTVGPAGLVQQGDGGGTGPGVAYQNVAITTLSSTLVVTAYQQMDETLAVEAWTIGADGTPTAEAMIATGDEAKQLSIATVNGNQVMTAINDLSDGDFLQVATWGVDSAGVQPLDNQATGYAVSPEGDSTVGVGAGSKLRIQAHIPFFEWIQAAVTPIIHNDNVGFVNWAISASGALTLNKPTVPSATSTDVAVAGCMLPENAPITASGNEEGFADVGRASPWTIVPTKIGNGILSMAMSNAGTGNYDYESGQYDAYFVTAVLAYEDDLSGAAAAPTAYLRIGEFSYQVRSPFGL